MSDKSWLRRRAVREAYATIDAAGKTDRNIDKQDIADAIEAVARAFASRAIESLFDASETANGKTLLTLKDPRAKHNPGYYGGAIVDSGTERIALSVSDYVGMALGHAERDE